MKFFILSISIFYSMTAFSERLPLEEKNQKIMQQVLTAQDELHVAFFDYDSDKVEKAAKEVAKKIDLIKVKELSKLLKVTQQKLREVSKDRSEKENKESFYVISLGLGNIVRKYDVGGKWNIYSCPMVKKSWIQNSQKVDKVQNPYAASMPECGSKETAF